MGKRPNIPEINKKTLEEYPIQMVGQPAVQEAPPKADAAAETPSSLVVAAPEAPPPVPVTDPGPPPEQAPVVAEPSSVDGVLAPPILPPKAGLPAWSLAAVLGVGVVSGWLIAVAIGPTDAATSLAVAEAVQAERAQSRAALEKAAQDVARAVTERDALRDARARTDQAVTQALGLVKASDSGRPMREVAARAMQEAGDDRQLREALSRLMPFAAPVATRAVLQREFEVQAGRLPPPSEPPLLLAAGAQLWSRVRAQFSSAGEAKRDVRAEALATARDALVRNDLAEAIQALRGLDDAAQPRMQGWIEAAQARMALDAAVEQVAAILVIRATRRFVE